MERKEAYAKIKELNLQEECKKKYGKNFTQCKTDELIHLIQSYIIKDKNNNKITETPTKKLSKVNVEKGFADYVDSFERLLETLRSKHILLDSEVKRILG